MKGRINNKLGEIQISSEVVALYAGVTAVECFGIVGMAAVSMKDGLVKLLKRESLTKGIYVKIEDNHINLAFHVIVAYGVSICAVADNLMANVKYKVEEFTGMKVDRINIYVEGVRVID
ncbi:MAG: Asp23/Gls24 family envelope stress response protein [Lachnospiraceae bacterium]|nr:Asp23/Gls24 family envelope stress response protein [Lachnospiraceae bacterium]MCI9184874.1 Asp23/Gls24 family envelope stress response protein [Lachnospiraceae bacterium]